MSNYLDDYVSVQDRLKEFINAYPDYRIKTHVLEESLASNCDVYIVKTELYYHQNQNKNNTHWNWPRLVRWVELLTLLDFLQSRVEHLKSQFRRQSPNSLNL